MYTYSSKLLPGSHIRIVSPSSSLGIISKEAIDIASERLKSLGFELSFGKHVKECDEYNSSSIESRVEDFMSAFLDKDVDCVMSVIGGHNCNQILPYLDYEVIKNNPKCFIGFSDITALNNAIYSMTGLVTYSGPAYSSFGKKLDFEYTMDYFKKCLMEESSYDILPSTKWSDDKWYVDQNVSNLINNPGYLKVNNGSCKGTIVGGNLCTLNLLQGTKYFPSLKDTILFIEDDHESSYLNFDRDLESLTQVEGFEGVKGVVIGRFQQASHVSNEEILRMVKNKKVLRDIPIVANVDFGHTDPKITFPIGGEASLSVTNEGVKLSILKH
ncbi:MAG: S66 peptidase family protein [bacterium]